MKVSRTSSRPLASNPRVILGAVRRLSYREIAARTGTTITDVRMAARALREAEREARRG